jgi:hypothetical protein
MYQIVRPMLKVRHYDTGEVIKIFLPGAGSESDWSLMQLGVHHKPVDDHNDDNGW